MRQIHSIIKYSLSTAALCACVLLTSAQKKDAYEMTINGVKVIVQPSGNEIVEIQTIIKGGVQNYPADKAGIESVAMNALTECGTTKDDKNSFKNKLDKVSAQVYGNTAMDYATFTMNCIKSDFETVWPLYVDALTSPLFDKKEFDRIKQDAINLLKSQSSDPDYSISKMAREVAFAGKNYAKTPEGSETTVSKLTADETKAYYKSILTRSRLLIVVVGEIDRSVLEQKIQSMLELVPAGNPFALKREVYSAAQNSFKSQKKDLATNYIQGVTGGPQGGTPDFNAFALASRIFYDRQFLEIRTNNGLSYAPYVYLDGGLSSSFNIDVSTTQPNKYIGVIAKLIDRTKKEGFKEDEVKNMKTTYLTGFFYKQETNSAQAGSLASNEILQNNWRRSLTINDDIKKVSVADVNKAFNKYVTHITWVYQGDPTKVNPDLYMKGTTHTLPSSKLNSENKN
jgi:predicted Zn-dependent peptidase